MTVQEKIALINTLHPKVQDFSIAGEEVEYIAVDLDDEVREVLYKLGKTDQWIEENSHGEDSINLADVGFEFATWWSSKNGFTA